MPQYRLATQVAAHIRAQLSSGYSANLSICCLSRQFATSETVLTKSFKKWHGVSVHAFIIHEKIAFATQLLLNSDTPIKLIAMQLGYSELANFSRDFARYTGVSPLAFRRGRGMGVKAVAAMEVLP